MIYFANRRAELTQIVNGKIVNNTSYDQLAQSMICYYQTIYLLNICKINSAIDIFVFASVAYHWWPSYYRVTIVDMILMITFW